MNAFVQWRAAHIDDGEIGPRRSGARVPGLSGRPQEVVGPAQQPPTRPRYDLAVLPNRAGATLSLRGLSGESFFWANQTVAGFSNELSNSGREGSFCALQAN